MSDSPAGPSADPVDQLARALRASEALVATVDGPQWTLPTPCPDWTVRDLVNHLVFGMEVFTGALGTGSTPSREELLARAGEDALGDDPMGAYRRAAESMLTAFSRPGSLERVVTIPFGSVPGIAALHLRVVECLVHGWDLARATGQPADLPQDLAETELAFSRAQLTELPPGRTPFAPPRPAPPDASAVEQLAAFLGRDVSR